MEKHKCKLCFRNFSNGRALGGHMRSHMLSLPVPRKPEVSPTVQLSFEAESASSSSSSSSEEEEEGEDKGLCYGLRENPKRSFRLVDPEFSIAADTGCGSVILQDRESETESSKNPTKRRSKRPWKHGVFDDQQHHHHHHHHHKQSQEHEAMKKMKLSKPCKNESWDEPEPMSSVSDTTTEEDVAFCLMMLSRDKWKRQKDEEELLEEEYEEEDEEDEDGEDEGERSQEESDESEEMKSTKTRVRGRYTCETCKKVFRSYQALGGHRASHKKIKVHATVDETELEHENGGTFAAPVADKKIHECPVCFRVFASGQALGGHKRTHVTGSATRVRTFTKFGDSLIDLNLPAPVDDDDISQIENSAVSDAEFVKLKPIRQ